MTQPAIEVTGFDPPLSTGQRQLTEFDQLLVHAHPMPRVIGRLAILLTR